MKRIIFVSIVLFAFSIMIGCGGNGTTVNVTSYPGSQGLDLQAVGALLGKAQNAENLEQLINDPSEGVNNLDLNNDGSTDFVKVEENVDGANFTYDLVDIDADQQPRLAQLTVTKTGEQTATVQYVGDPNYYGPNSVGVYHMSLADAIFLSYVFRPHPYYVSPYRMGYMPSYYRVRPIIPYTQYRTRTTETITTTRIKPQVSKAPEIRTSKMPDYTKSVPPPPTKSLTNPPSSQRSLSTDKQTTGGTGPTRFGSTNPATKPPSSAPKAPAPPRSLGGKH